MSALVTDWPNMNPRSTPLQYRLVVAMQRASGIGDNLNHWTEADAALATRMIAIDKRMRPTVGRASCTRVISPTANTDLAFTEYICQDGTQPVLLVCGNSTLRT